MRLRLSNLILVVGIVFALDFVTPKSVYAQLCNEDRPIDLFECDEPRSNDTCDAPTFVGRGAVDCYIDNRNGECRSITSVCNSRDSCVPVFNNVEDKLECWCTLSVVECNLLGGGGCSGSRGIGEACSDNCECTSGRCSNTRGICVNSAG